MPIALPMSYTSVGIVNSAFPAITSVYQLTSAQVAHYGGGVEAEINTKISKRYALPLTVECPLLTAIATRETIYRIVVERMLVQAPTAQQGTSPLQSQHKDDQKLLEQIMNGELQLVTASGAVLTPDTTQLEFYSTTKDYTPTMHEGEVTDQVQDPSKLLNILGDRGLT